jgi:hypothetical protein
MLPPNGNVTVHCIKLNLEEGQPVKKKVEEIRIQ